jgi:hypothetical protein
MISVLKAMFKKLENQAPEEKWEQSGLTARETLLAMLTPFAATIPPALVNQLRERLQQPPNRHWLRWVFVFEAHYGAGLRWRAAYDYASARLADTYARGGKDTMAKSYKRVTRANQERKMSMPKRMG